MTLNRLARFALVSLVALPLAAEAQEERPPLPERNPLRAHAKAPPISPLPGDAPTVAWTDAEIAKAKTKCATLLDGLALDYEPLPPLKDGRCGAPAPVLLKALGNNPRVEIDPPATVTCAVAAALSAWLDKTVQPAARGSLGMPVVKLSNASSYVCRNRYNGTDTPLSEHALANALDVSEFVFQSGETLTVLASWPRLVSGPPAPKPNPTRVSASPEITGSIASSPPGAKTVDAVDITTATTASAKRNPFVPAKADARTNPFVLPAAVPKAPPPKPPAEATPPPPPPASERKAEFVAKVHDAACGTFGTVLGPNANAAHKDHFHLDMKARARRAICE
jgi:hypothetical protein